MKIHALLLALAAAAFPVVLADGEYPLFGVSFSDHECDIEDALNSATEEVVATLLKEVTVAAGQHDEGNNRNLRKGPSAVASSPRELSESPPQDHRQAWDCGPYNPSLGWPYCA